MAAVNLQPDAFHGEWNYTIMPNGRRNRPQSRRIRWFRTAP
jgi:hypothetical protein